MELTRGLDPTLLAAISDPAGFYPVVLIESVWPDGTVNMHSGNGALSWDSKSWTGIAAIAEMRAGPEQGGAVPSEAAMTVRGTITDVLSYADPAARGGRVRLWVGATTAPGGTTLVGTPALCFTGYLDANDSMLDAAVGDAELTVTAATGPAARERAAISHSAEDQRITDANDTLFERCSAAADWRSIPIQFPDPS
jgi:hypothetical protein